MLEIYGERTLDRAVRDEQRLLGFAQKLRAAATAFERVPPALDEVCDAATAIHLVLDTVAGDALPPEADAAAIELLGWLELHMDDAPVAILTGMNEPFVPEAMNADAFLPDALRSTLGIEDNDRRCARDAYQLTAMLHSRRVHVIAGRRTLLGDSLRPSRLLLATSGATLARRIRNCLGLTASPAWPVPATDTTRPLREPAADTVHPLREPAARTARFALPPVRTLALAAVPTTLTVTEFGSVLQDPYAWALQRAIASDAMDDAQRELDPMRFGELAHRVLEAFGRTAAASSDNADVVAAALDECLDAYIAAQFGAVFPAVRLQVEQLRLRLRAFAAHQARRVADGWRTVAVEYGTPEGGVPLPFDLEFRVTGRIDRIDWHAATGAWAVFDYKTDERGTDPESAHRRQGRWLDLQLPLYRHILPHVEDGAGNRAFHGGPDTDVRDVRMGYILLCGDPARIRFAEASWTQDDLCTAMEAARTVVETVRRNVYEFAGPDSRRYAADMAELLGYGRLALDDDETSEEVPA
jgi:hypothetical protein